MKTWSLILAGVLATAMSSASLAAPILTNGSFEDGPALGSFGFTRVFEGDSASIVGWTVIGKSVELDSIDYVGFWQNADGKRSVDLNGSRAGGIQQTFATTIGRTYEVRFAYAGNPDRDYDKILKFRWINGTEDASDPAEITLTFLQDGFTRENMGWIEVAYSFVATELSATLRFLSGNCNCGFGPALDNVRVTEVPVPLALPLFLSALGALGVVSRRKSA